MSVGESGESSPTETQKKPPYKLERLPNSGGLIGVAVGKRPPGQKDFGITVGKVVNPKPGAKQ